MHLQAELGRSEINDLKAPKVVAVKNGTSPLNKRIEPIALGRHALCVRWVYSMRISKGRAGDTTGQSFPGLALRPCSRLIRALYGRTKSRNASNARVPGYLGWTQLDYKRRMSEINLDFKEKG